MIVLAIAIPLCLGMGISAVGGSDSNDITVVEPSPSPSPTATPVPTATPSPTPKPIQEIFLVPGSVEENLEVQILDKNDELVTGDEFILTVTGVKNGYKSVWTVNDGFLELTKLSSGDYKVTIDEKEGYIIKITTVDVKVAKKVDYEKVDVSDKVVDESQIDVSKEDAAFDNQPVMTPAPPPKDTVEYVKSSSKTVKKDVEVTKYRYKVTDKDLMKDGTLKTKDGKSSGLYPVLDKNGYLESVYKLVYPTPVPTTRAQAMSLLSTVNLSPAGLWLTALAVEGEEVESEPTPEPTPTPEPEPTPEPTPEDPTVGILQKIIDFIKHIIELITKKQGE